MIAFNIVQLPRIKTDLSMIYSRSAYAFDSINYQLRARVPHKAFVPCIISLARMCREFLVSGASHATFTFEIRHIIIITLATVQWK